MKKTFIFLFSTMFLMGCASNYGTPPVGRMPTKPMMAPPPLYAPKDSAPISSTKTYSGKSFSFEYPADLTVSEIDGTAVLAKLESYTPNTNLGSAVINVLMTDNEATCGDGKNWGVQVGSTQKELINGITFEKKVFEDAGMGSREENILYSTVSNHHCYSAMLIMIYGALPGAYETPPPAFDHAKIEAVLTGVVESFKFAK